MGPVPGTWQGCRRAPLFPSERLAKSLAGMEGLLTPPVVPDTFRRSLKMASREYLRGPVSDLSRPPSSRNRRRSTTRRRPLRLCRLHPPTSSPPQAHRPYRSTRDSVTGSSERQRFSSAASASGSKGATRPANSFAASSSSSNGCRNGSTSAQVRACAHSSVTTPLRVCGCSITNPISSGSATVLGNDLRCLRNAWPGALVNSPVLDVP